MIFPKWHPNVSLGCSGRDCCAHRVWNAVDQLRNTDVSLMSRAKLETPPGRKSRLLPLRGKHRLCREGLGCDEAQGEWEGRVEASRAGQGQAVLIHLCLLKLCFGVLCDELCSLVLLIYQN